MMTKVHTRSQPGERNLTTMKLWKFSSHMSDTDLLGGDHNSPECVYIVWEKGGGGQIWSWSST